MTNVFDLKTRNRSKPPQPAVNAASLDAITVARELSQALGMPVMTESVATIVATLNRHYSAGQRGALQHAHGLVLAEREACHNLRQTLVNPFGHCQISAHAYDMAIVEYGRAIRERGQI